MSSIYETQVSMRKVRKAALQKGYLAVLDIGTSKISCFILKIEGEVEDPGTHGVGGMLGQSSFRIIGEATTMSRGVLFGEIDAMNKAERAIRSVLQTSQRNAGVRVDHVVACFSGGKPESFVCSGAIDLDDHVVKEGDVARVLATCDLPHLTLGREVLHAQPINFTLDNRSGLTDPRGQMGQRLYVDMHMVTAESNPIYSILNCVKKCDMELAGVVSSSYASALSTLVEDEQELGAACIDMGGGTTSICVFMKRHMVYAESIRVGGYHVTNDIAMGLQIPFGTAERIKTLSGGVYATNSDDFDLVDIGGDTGDWDYDRRTITRSELISIIRPRVEETLEEVRDTLKAGGFDHMPSQKVVLTGGASQVPGLADLAHRILGCQVRLGRPARILGLGQNNSGPAFSSAVGMCQLAVHPQDECWDFELPDHKYGGQSLRRAFRWLKENW